MLRVIVNDVFKRFVIEGRLWSDDYEDAQVKNALLAV